MYLPHHHLTALIMLCQSFVVAMLMLPSQRQPHMKGMPQRWGIDVDFVVVVFTIRMCVFRSLQDHQGNTHGDAADGRVHPGGRHLRQCCCAAVHVQCCAGHRAPLHFAFTQAASAAAAGSFPLAYHSIHTRDQGGEAGGPSYIREGMGGFCLQSKVSSWSR